MSLSKHLTTFAKVYFTASYVARVCFWYLIQYIMTAEKQITLKMTFSCYYYPHMLARQLIVLLTAYIKVRVIGYRGVLMRLIMHKPWIYESSAIQLMSTDTLKMIDTLVCQ